MEIKFKYLDIIVDFNDRYITESVIESKYCSLINNIVFEIINNRFHNGELNHIGYLQSIDSDFRIVAESMYLQQSLDKI